MMNQPTIPPDAERPSGQTGGYPPASETRQRILAAAAFLLVLVAGGLGGITLDRWLLRPEHPLESMTLPDDALLLRPRDVSQRELARELRLTPTQQQHLDSLLTDAQARVRAVSREVGPQFRAIVAETLTSLRAILAPEQREQLRTIRHERQILRRERVEELRRRGFDIPDSAYHIEGGTRGR